MNTKLNKLKQILQDMDKVLIAYSGGVDSTFLLKIAVDTLGKDNVLAVTARSETYPQSELRQAIKLTKEIDANHLFIDTDELTVINFKTNPKDRCYYCKKELFTKLRIVAKKNDIKYIADGTNADDTNDFRPGEKAASEEEVIHPLRDAELTKQDIRDISKDLGLETWDKPQMACLSSRFPYGEDITKDKLKKIEKAENFLKEQGIVQVRVRYHNNIARIEIGQDQINKFFDDNFREQTTEKFRELGFLYITLDLEGYKTGSMNKIVTS